MFVTNLNSISLLYLHAYTRAHARAACAVRRKIWLSRFSREPSVHDILTMMMRPSRCAHGPTGQITSKHKRATSSSSANQTTTTGRCIGGLVQLRRECRYAASMATDDYEGVCPCGQQVRCDCEHSCSNPRRDAIDFRTHAPRPRRSEHGVAKHQKRETDIYIYE